MSVSSFFGTRIAAIPTLQINGTKTARQQPATTVVLPVECSSRPQKKATAHHMKTRPKKTARWDIKRRPTVYAPFPPLPSDFTVVSSGDADDDDAESSPTVVAEFSEPAKSQ